MKKLIFVAASIAAMSIAFSGHAQQTPRTTVAQGALVGIMDNGVSAFLGIPYAAPPVGAGRWAPPRTAPNWGAAPRAADKYGPACPQVIAPKGGRAPWTDEFMHPAALGVSEDCLTLNVWTPAALSSGQRPQGNLPVLVYIYGGAFQEGSNAIAAYNGANFAKKGVVVVNLNYRVGALGFLAAPEFSAEQGGSSGNYGIQDQIAGLQWIRDNIAAFGGDSNKVTIAGQSAGGMSVHALIASPMAKGLFRGAIVQAGGIGGTFSEAATPEANGSAFIKTLGAASIAEARAMPFEKIMATPAPRGGVIADGKIIPKGREPTPAASDVPVLIGANLNEGGVKTVTAETWKVQLADRYGTRAAEALKLYPANSDAQARDSAEREAADRTALSYEDFVVRRASDKPLYAYQFTHVLPGPEQAKFGAFHTSELPYVFNTLHLTIGRNITEKDRSIADETSSYWANFVKSGNPNGAGLAQWLPFSDDKQVMFLGNAPAARKLDLRLLRAGRAPAGQSFGPPPSPAP